MRLLGLIGGTSWHATQMYYDLINRKASEILGTAANPTLLLYSQNIAIMKTGDLEIIIPSYIDIANKLKVAGAEKLMLLANTPHLVVDAVEKETGLSFIHIVDSTAKRAKELGVSKLGLLGTLTTMTKPFLKDRFKEKHGLEVIVPEEEHLPRVHARIAGELTQGTFTDEARAFFLNKMDELVDRGAEAIILGCTELPILMKGTSYKVPLLDTTKLHAYDAVSFILGQ